MAGVTGLELATFCVTGRRSNQLNYTPKTERPTVIKKMVGVEGLEPPTTCL